VSKVIGKTVLVKITLVVRYQKEIMWKLSYSVIQTLLELSRNQFFLNGIVFFLMPVTFTQYCEITIIERIQMISKIIIYFEKV